MKKFKFNANCFSAGEKALWLISVSFITLSFLFFDRANYLTLAASLIGVTSLIFCAKGNAFGQLLMIIFSVLYGMISFGFAYYGEMMTYLGMTAPMAVISLISWLKNPFEKDKAEVKVNKINLQEMVFMAFLTAAVTAVFYFITQGFRNG